MLLLTVKCLCLLIFFILTGESKTAFYSYRLFDNYGETYNRAEQCTNLKNKHGRPVSFATDKCILIFTKSDCNGKFDRFPTGNWSSLGEFKDLTYYSFKECYEGTPWIKFYNKPDYEDVLIGYNEESLYPFCTTIHNDLRTIKSIETSECVVLFTYENCQGSALLIKPGSGSELAEDFKNLIASFRVCRGNEIVPHNFDVVFYSGLYFKGGSFSFVKASNRCQNLAQPFRKVPQSLKVKKCIDLFEEEECQGIPYKVNKGEVRNLQYFRQKTLSFRSCNDLDRTEFHVKFYSKGNFTDVILDVDLALLDNQGDNGKFCYGNYLKGKVFSIITPVCIELLSSYDCNGGFSVRLTPGNYTKLPDYISDKIGSICPCYVTDLIWQTTTSKTITSTRDPKLGRSYSIG